MTLIADYSVSIEITLTQEAALPATLTKVAELDSRDREITRERMAAFLECSEPKVGDYFKFADGVERRISHVWEGCADDGGDLVQTSNGGSFYLGHGYCSFSGGLRPGIKASTLTRTGSIRVRSCWFFHHDYRIADGGVGIMPPIFDEWTSSEVQS